MSELSKSVDTLTTEILILKQQTAQNIIEIGKRLIQVKESLGHGEWGKWLDQEVDIHERTAQKFMKAASELANTPSMAYLGAAKVFAILDLPAEQREPFIQENPVDQMSTRQLQAAIKAQKEAEKLAADTEEENQMLRQENQKLAARSQPQVQIVEKTVEKIIEKPIEIIKEVLPDDYGDLKERLESLRLEYEAVQRRAIEVQELKQQKELVESKNKLLQGEIDLMRSSRLDDRLSTQTKVSVFANMVKEFIDKVAPMGYLAQEYVRTSPECQKKYDAALSGLEKWCRDMRDNLVVPEKSKIYDAEVIDI